MTTPRTLSLAAALFVAMACAPVAPAAVADDDTAPAAARSAAAELHGPFDALLAEIVSGNGLVDYKALAKDTSVLDTYVAALGRVDPASLDRPSTIAFWINAYNAFTLRLILDHYPKIDSIKDISRGDRWKAVRWNVQGKKYSLDQIEHEILRPMGDARVHFGLVCAALSCPNLAPFAYMPETLDEQLDMQGRTFLADKAKGLKTYTESGWFGGPVLEISAIFDWFEEDFESDSTDVVDFVLKYAPAADAAFIRKNRKDLDVEHLDYDWSLNVKR